MADHSHSSALKTAEERIQHALASGETALNLSGLSFTELPTALSSLAKQLTFLDISRCAVLTSIAGIESLTKLTRLSADSCESLASLNGIESLTKLA